MEELENNDRAEIFSKAVRAGKRTYFFDVKSTRGNDFYLTVTESKKRFLEDGKFRYEKHKIFLYKEDFEKFIEGLNETIAKINELKSQFPSNESVENVGATEGAAFTNVDFDDLGNQWLKKVNKLKGSLVTVSLFWFKAGVFLPKSDKNPIKSF